MYDKLIILAVGGVIAVGTVLYYMFIEEKEKENCHRNRPRNGPSSPRPRSAQTSYDDIKPTSELSCRNRKSVPKNTLITSEPDKESGGNSNSPDSSDAACNIEPKNETIVSNRSYKAYETNESSDLNTTSPLNVQIESQPSQEITNNNFASSNSPLDYPEDTWKTSKPDKESGESSNSPVSSGAHCEIKPGKEGNETSETVLTNLSFEAYGINESSDIKSPLKVLNDSQRTLGITNNFSSSASPECYACGKPPNAILYPCEHQKLCLGCAEYYLNFAKENNQPAKCPIKECRTVITYFRETFYG